MFLLLLFSHEHGSQRAVRVPLFIDESFFSEWTLPQVPFKLMLTFCVTGEGTETTCCSVDSIGLMCHFMTAWITLVGECSPCIHCRRSPGSVSVIVCFLIAASAGIDHRSASCLSYLYGALRNKAIAPGRRASKSCKVLRWPGSEHQWRWALPAGAALEKR